MIKRNNIKKIREEKDITLTQISKDTGLSLSYLSILQSGKRDLTDDSVQKIAKALQCDPEELVTYCEYGEGVNMAFVSNIKLIRRVRGMSQEKLGKIIGCSQAAIFALESGRHRLSKKWIDKISHALQCTPHDIINRDYNNTTAKCGVNDVTQVVKKNDDNIVNIRLAHFSHKQNTSTISIGKNLINTKIVNQLRYTYVKHISCNGEGLTYEEDDIVIFENIEELIVKRKIQRHNCSYDVIMQHNDIYSLYNVSYTVTAESIRESHNIAMKEAGGDESKLKIKPIYVYCLKYMAYCGGGQRNYNDIHGPESETLEFKSLDDMFVTFKVIGLVVMRMSNVTV